ncbi:MAG TPA: hypothetical protein VFM13_00235 [Gaiellaceae bacterium]|nr:hypothetical protein [Gaiellaceae bacterium]
MGRTLVVRILILLGALFAILSLVAGYIRFQALDTDSVEATAGDMIADPEIRNQISATLVEQFFANVDVEAALQERLPPDQQALAGPLAGVVRLGADRLAGELLERPRPQQLWVRTITESHRNLIRILEDETGPVSTEDGRLVLDLQPLLIQLGDRVAVVGRVSERVFANPDAGRITIMEADRLETAQDLTQILKVLGMWLWIVPIALWAIAVWLADGMRRSALRMIGISSIVAGLLVLVIRRIAGSMVVDELATTESVQRAAGDAWDILTAQLRDGGLTLLGIGVILLVAVWIAGTSTSATDTRRWLAPHIARPEIAFGGAAVLLGLLVWWGPTIQTQRWQLVLVSAVVLALGVEVLRRQTANEFPTPERKGAPHGNHGSD